MKSQKARLMAATLLKTGESKIWVNPLEIQRVKEAMTKEDLRVLIGEGIVKRKKEQYQNRKRVLKKKKGRKRGQGKRRGTAKARTSPKENWMKTVRAQRKKLRELKKSGSGKLKISYRKAYKMIKGGYFRGKKHLESAVLEAKK